MAGTPDISPYALCDPEDVADLLGYDDDQANNRQRTIVRAINSATTAIRRRSQREFKQTAAELAATRFFKITSPDLTTRQVRIGDFSAIPSQVRIWTPDRDTFEELAVDDDIALSDCWPTPDTPDPGMPFEWLYFKSDIDLTVDNWLSVKTDWGFPEVPDDITQIAIGTAAEWILNDVMKLTELARQQGRPVRLQSLIPSQYQETVDGYRIYRVS